MSTTTSTIPTTFTVRRVRQDEYAEAGRITHEAYAASYADDLSEQYVASLLDAAGRDHEGEVWVAVDADGSTIVGTVWIATADRPLSPIARPGETDFRQLAVAPTARGRGIGEALTRHVIATARARGSNRVVMNSGPQMTGAHALYAKLGFTRDAEREGWVEVEPGRWVDLMTFIIDVPPTA